MSGNSIPPGYHPQDELWTQDTVVFDAVRDDHDGRQAGPGGGRPRNSQASRYLIIGLTATIVVALLAIGGLLLSGHGGWNAAPNATKGPAPTRIVLTTTTPASPTTTAQAAEVTTAPDTTTATTTTTTTTTTATTTSAAAVSGTCTQAGQTAVAGDGSVLTCNVAGDDTLRWLSVSTPSLGFPCNATEAGTFGYAPNGTQLLCSRRAGSTTPTYVWDSPGPVTSGTHEPGTICNLKKDVVAKSSSGRAVTCLPTNGNNNGNYVGAWKPVS
ncbi:hypothetical protein ACFXPS_00130 [Nocardia sp. NPDC059091]|uniref:hypothetical protein n=1 Tax=unclassified Nocardia TaxID=2637762 RepID=UPI0036AF5B2F